MFLPYYEALKVLQYLLNRPYVSMVMVVSAQDGAYFGYG